MQSGSGTSRAVKILKTKFLTSTDSSIEEVKVSKYFKKKLEKLKVRASQLAECVGLESLMPETTARRAREERTPPACLKKEREKYVNCELEAIEILRKSAHPNLVRIFDVMIVDRYTYIYMEHLAAGTVEDYTKMKTTDGKLLEQRIVQKWTRQIAEALKYMHFVLFMAHRDLKPDNIMLDDELNCKLIDFGFACSTGKEFMTVSSCLSPNQMPIKFAVSNHTSYCGTYWYMAPEVILFKSGIKSLVPYVAEQADMYSFGICLFEMISGVLPSCCTSHRCKVLQSHIKSEVYSMFSIDGFDLMYHLTDPNPDRRYNALKVLDHPFVTNV